MISTIVIWIFDVVCFLFCGGASLYFFMSLNSDLMSDIMPLWLTLLVLGVLSAVECVYFIAFLVFKIISMSTLALTFTNILLLFDPLLQVVGNLAILGCVYIYDPAAGNDDAIFQIIIIMLGNILKYFVTYLTLKFNYDAVSTSYDVEEAMPVMMSERRGPYTFVPAKDAETVEAPKQLVQPVFLVPLPHNYKVAYVPQQ
jgi:hypothetical protein